MMQPSSLNGPVLLLVGLVSITATLAPRAAADPPSSQPAAPAPDPKLQPQDVVRIVIDALSKNDAGDSGIRTTWKFASPANQSVTGPVERFIPMVKSPAYAPMLNSKSARYGNLQIQGDQALQVVFLTATDGTKVGYIFQLSRQSDGPFKGCWMTDGVFPMKPAAPPAQDGNDQPV